ncbi:MAG: pyridoxamine 5'-phosphate oxidase family protein [Burkholderiales bacterium]|nr:pyridoxamine 5'-phosphate oxidase family protein [Burkholderiales bacterium]
MTATSEAGIAASPFHRGETELQARAGVRERVEHLGRTIIRDHMPEQHRELFGKLPTLVIGAVDGEGQPWATMLVGTGGTGGTGSMSAAGGFISTPDARTLLVAALPAPSDPVAPLLVPGAALGVLGIEPRTRRRNRANGKVTMAHDGRPAGAGAGGATAGFEMHVQQSFGNCPKYIQARTPLPRPRVPGEPRDEGRLLGEEALALVRGADTLFIATASARRPASEGHGGEGVDVSHRGGRPGFVQVTASGGGHRLTLPDYAGNNLYNTLGNLLVWPFAGLLFIDHESGDMLQLAARAELQHGGPELDAFPGAQRLLHLHVLHGRWRPAALPLAWTAPEFAPQLLPPAGS